MTILRDTVEIDWKGRKMEVSITIWPAQRMTFHQPGYPSEFEVGKVVDIATGREMTERWWDEHVEEVHDIIEEIG